MVEKKKPPRSWAAWILVMVPLVAVIAFYAQRQVPVVVPHEGGQKPTAAASASADNAVQPVPPGLWNIDFPDLAGKRQRLAQWKGKVLVVNFWATWCPPCRAEVPDFIHAQEKYRKQGLQFVGIALDHPDAVKTFAKEFRINYPVLQAETGGMELAEAMGNVSDALPYTIVIDRQGNVVATATGMLDPDKIGKLMRPLLGI